MSSARRSPHQPKERWEEASEFLCGNFSEIDGYFSPLLDPSDPIFENKEAQTGQLGSYFLQKVQHPDEVSAANSFFYSALYWDGGMIYDSPDTMFEIAEDFKKDVLDALLWSCFGTTRSRAIDLLGELEESFHSALTSENGSLFSIKNVPKGWMHDSCVASLQEEAYPLWCPSVTPLGATENFAAKHTTRELEDTPLKERELRAQLKKTLEDARNRAVNEFKTRYEFTKKGPFTMATNEDPLLQKNADPQRCEKNKWNLLTFAPNLPSNDDLQPRFPNEGRAGRNRVTKHTLGTLSRAKPEMVERLQSYLFSLWKEAVETQKKKGKIYLRNLDQNFGSDDHIVGTVYMILSFYRTSVNIDVGLLSLAYSEFKGTCVVLQTTQQSSRRRTLKRAFVPVVRNRDVKTHLYLLEEATESGSWVFVLEQVRHLPQCEIKKLDAHVSELERAMAFPVLVPSKATKEGPRTKTAEDLNCNKCQISVTLTKQAVQFQAPKPITAATAAAATAAATTTTTTTTTITTTTTTNSLEEVLLDPNDPTSAKAAADAQVGQGGEVDLGTAKTLTVFCTKWRRSSVSVLFKGSLKRRAKILNLVISEEQEKGERSGTCRIPLPKPAELIWRDESARLTKSSLESFFKLQFACAPYQTAGEKWLELFPCEYASLVFNATRIFKAAPGFEESPLRSVTEDLLAPSIDTLEGDFWHQETRRVIAVDTDAQGNCMGESFSTETDILIATKQKVASALTTCILPKLNKVSNGSGDGKMCFVGEAPFRLCGGYRRLFHVESLLRSADCFGTNCKIFNPRSGGSAHFPFLAEISDETSLARLLFSETGLFDESTLPEESPFLVPSSCIVCGSGFALDDTKALEDVLNKMDQMNVKGNTFEDSLFPLGLGTGSADVVRAFANTRCATFALGDVAVIPEMSAPAAPSVLRQSSSWTGATNTARDPNKGDVLGSAILMAEKFSESLNLNNAIGMISGGWLTSMIDNDEKQPSPPTSNLNKDFNTNSSVSCPLTFLLPVPKNAVAMAFLVSEELHSCDPKILWRPGKCEVRKYKMLGYKELGCDFPLAFQLDSEEFAETPRNQRHSGWVYVIVTQISEQLSDRCVHFRWQTGEGGVPTATFLGPMACEEPGSSKEPGGLPELQALPRNSLRQYVRSSYANFISKLHEINKK